jgi:amidase
MCGSPRHLHLGHDDARLFFDKGIPPIVEVAPGSTLVVDTLDCTAGRITSETDLIRDLDALIHELGGLNFVTGPIAVEGVRPGDVLRVTVVDIDPAPDTHRGFIATIPGFGTFDHEEPHTTICDVSRAEVLLPFPSGRVRLPSRPFIGTIGVAPTFERRMTLSQSPDHLGDLDIPQLRPGSTLHVRANHSGGLLSIGDVHAVQGDGEFAGVAVEIGAKVTLRIEVTPRGESTMNSLPLLIDSEQVGVVAAFQGLPTNVCVQHAAEELCGLLTRLGMSRSDAIQYLSAAARVRLGNMFEPFFSTYVSVQRSTIPVVLPEDLIAG